MSTTQQLAARMTEKASENLIANIEAMPTDKQAWKPLDAGRSALSQVQECAVINPFFGAILRDRAVPNMPWNEYEARCAALDTAAKATSALVEATAGLVAAIEAFPDNELQNTITLPFGEGMTMTYAQVLFASYWNMVYHTGQIAYIQTLYGDTQMYGKP
jgi:uncharacterized damage-inducible protein DinB